MTFGNKKPRSEEGISVGESAMETDDLEELKTATRRLEEMITAFSVRKTKLDEMITALPDREIWERVYATLGGGSFVMLVALLFSVSKESGNVWTQISLCFFAIALPVNVVMYLMHTPGIYKLCSAYRHKKSFEIYHAVGFFIAQLFPQFGLTCAILNTSWIAASAFGVASISLNILQAFIAKAHNQIRKDQAELNKDQDEVIKDLQEKKFFDKYVRRSVDPRPLNGLILDIVKTSVP